ncbi:protein of unknown function [Magnetospirillum gryphiswaldense MSR-1 v2]|uniref:Uncharacterized protein n=1 Tax=Magnetospirillum gryphiswaldense (strain DSM 6361 / JCM 21280 / NBRC 15271 / MSR-1) TaxID=431944 RepID=V6F3J0_MAGGM|nr:protein of unknown function [Magnetospirillum gryphiswaldense MSR-1 v2]
MGGSVRPLGLLGVLGIAHFLCRNVKYNKIKHLLYVKGKRYVKNKLFLWTLSPGSGKHPVPRHLCKT